MKTLHVYISCQLWSSYNENCSQSQQIQWQRMETRLHLNSDLCARSRPYGAGCVVWDEPDSFMVTHRGLFIPLSVCGPCVWSQRRRRIVRMEEMSAMSPTDDISDCSVSVSMLYSQVSFISITLYTIQIVWKQIHRDKQDNNRVNTGNSLGCTINHILIMIMISASLYLSLTICDMYPLVIYPEKVSF